jgi:hypothetical protein
MILKQLMLSVLILLLLEYVDARCDYPEVEAKKAIFLQHMGLLRKPMRYFEPCDLLTTWGAECDASMELGLGLLKGHVQQGCHLPAQDIVVPPGPFEFVKGSGFESFKSPYTNDELKGLNRTNLLYYSGKIGEHFWTTVVCVSSHYVLSVLVQVNDMLSCVMTLYSS